MRQPAKIWECAAELPVDGIKPLPISTTQNQNNIVPHEEDGQIKWKLSDGVLRKNKRK